MPLKNIESISKLTKSWHMKKGYEYFQVKICIIILLIQPIIKRSHIVIIIKYLHVKPKLLEVNGLKEYIFPQYLLFRWNKNLSKCKKYILACIISSFIILKNERKKVLKSIITN